MTSSSHWFRSAVVYQIYIRSFFDASDDGVGDLAGVIQKLDYLRGGPDSLNIDAIWLSPFYPSPMADYGYDVSNYRDVDPQFGTLSTFRELLAQAHDRGLKVLVDFVPNHSSDEHPWFKVSRQSRHNPKRDWYIWRDPKADGSPPTNWLSVFGGSAWELDPQTGQYYLHSFLSKQPDLNWANPEVRAAMKEVMRFWLDLGVDGLRVDAVDWLSKDLDPLADDPLDPAYDPATQKPYYSLRHLHSKKGSQEFTYLREMAEVIESYPERFMITEMHTHQWDDAKTYRNFYTKVDPAVSAPFNFEGIFSPWTAKSFKDFINDFQKLLKGDDVPVYCLGNHDKSRLASRIGRRAARTAAVLLLTLPGMPVIYNGDELGMVDGEMRREEKEDRTPERTPFPWNDHPQAGFTSGTPWLPVTPEYPRLNAATQLAEPSSLLTLYRRLLDLRHHSEALQHGRHQSFTVHPDVVSYFRESPSQKLAVFLNFSDHEITTQVPFAKGEELLSTHSRTLSEVTHTLTLRPHEGLVVALPS
ncbi:MAG TPA: alpha-amylase family glycosyl hydrolase [Candidatus Saccharimonadales bacterium]|nr:alpha-amylase family glycosyl hydrolase [Candidatus Saccharimonadales bacterium]